MIKNIFGSRRAKESERNKISEIGLPTNVVHGMHVSKNQQTGHLEGLPKSWIRMMDALITHDEQSKNPEAAYQAVKFYSYSIKKKEATEPFKPFITEDAIHEETESIDQFLDQKTTHKSEDSLAGSSEENESVPQPPPPPLPKKSMTLPPKPQLKPKPKNYTSKVYKGMENLHLIDTGSNSDTMIIHNAPHLTHQSSYAICTNVNNNNSLDQEPEPAENDLILRPKEKLARQPKSDEQVYHELKKICNLNDPLQRYEKTVEVGKGASGVVFIALDRNTGAKVAIKTIDMKNQSSKESILNEINVLKDFNHKNLVNFLEAYYLEDVDQLWVILDWDKLSDNLKDFLDRCLQVEVDMRASADELLRHPFLQDCMELRTLTPLIKAARRLLKRDN
uniref:non-specific serine/threonine protein kinase n=1 Tax=Anopheles epiroticus TaxID=199890 RepID=A0A182P9R1_9DIPT